MDSELRGQRREKGRETQESHGERKGQVGPLIISQSKWTRLHQWWKGKLGEDLLAVKFHPLCQFLHFLTALSADGSCSFTHVPYGCTAYISVLWYEQTCFLCSWRSGLGECRMKGIEFRMSRLHHYSWEESGILEPHRSRTSDTPPLNLLRLPFFLSGSALVIYSLPYQRLHGWSVHACGRLQEHGGVCVCVSVCCTQASVNNSSVLVDLGAHWSSTGQISCQRQAPRCRI